jgi:hypothetical protein
VARPNRLSGPLPPHHFGNELVAGIDAQVVHDLPDPPADRSFADVRAVGDGHISVARDHSADDFPVQRSELRHCGVIPDFRTHLLPP